MGLFLGILLGGFLFGSKGKRRTKCWHGISLKKKCKKCKEEYLKPRSSVSLSPSASTSPSYSSSPLTLI